jgi:hypothetical protein
MRIGFLATLVVFLVAANIFAQQPDDASVCLEEVPSGVLLNICGNERGMAPLPQPRLYLRIYKDGRGEYEKNTTWNVLTRKEFKVKDENLREIERLIAIEGVQKAAGAYPAYRTGTDSSRELTVSTYSERGSKRIVLTNFHAADRDNKKHYPASLISLMEKVEEVWEEANGIVREIPSITFCTLMADREYLLDKRVRIYADLELGIGSGSYLHDLECDQERSRARSDERISFAYDEEKLGKGFSVREIVRQKGYETYVTRIRVLVEGLLREETRRTKHNYPYRFVIERFLNVEQIVVGYEGELKQGWIYSDTFDHRSGAGLKLSSPLQSMIHHAQRIEWTNEDKFPALRRSGRKHITFRVISKEMRQIEKYRWNDLYTCEIIQIVENLNL